MEFITLMDPEIGVMIHQGGPDEEAQGSLGVEDRGEESLCCCLY